MSSGQPKQSAGLDDACTMLSSTAPQLQGHFDGLPSPHTLCRSFGTPPPAASIFGISGCQDQLAGLATCGPQPSGFTPRDGEPADPLSLADDDFTSFAFNLAWGHEEYGQPQPSPASRAWHRLGTDASSELRVPTSPFASAHAADVPNPVSLAQAALNSSSKVLIDSVPYPPFGSAAATIVSTQEGDMRRASTLTSTGSDHLHKRPCEADLLEEACKRAKSTPDLSHNSSTSGSLTSDDFSVASGSGHHLSRRRSTTLLRQSPGEPMASPTLTCTPGQFRPDAGSAAATPVLEGLPPKGEPRKPKVAVVQTRSCPSSTLKPFAIVKSTDGEMTLAQLNSRIKAITTSDLGPTSPTLSVGAASSAQSEGSPMILSPLPGTAGTLQQGAHSSPSTRSVKPPIRIKGTSSLAGSGITIKQMFGKAWQR